MRKILVFLGLRVFGRAFQIRQPVLAMFFDLSQSSRSHDGAYDDGRADCGGSARLGTSYRPDLTRWPAQQVGEAWLLRHMDLVPFGLR